MHKIKNGLHICLIDLISISTNMFANGFRRIWDAGHCKLVYKRLVGYETGNYCRERF